MKTIIKLSLMLCLATTTLLQGASISNDPCKKYKTLLDNVIKDTVLIGDSFTLKKLLASAKEENIILNVNVRNPLHLNFSPLAVNCDNLVALLKQVNTDPELFNMNRMEITERFTIWSTLKNAGADLTRQSFLEAKAKTKQLLQQLMQHDGIKALYDTFKKNLVLEEEAEEAPLTSPPGDPQVKNEEEEEEGEKKQNAATK